MKMTPAARHLLLAHVAILCMAPALRAQAPADRAAGRWDGAIALPTAELRVEVELRREGDALQGSISIPQQGARDLPLTILRRAGDSVAFAIRNVPGDPTFRGVIAAGDSAIEGMFTQAAVNAPFRLTRAGAAAAARPTPSQRLAGLDSVVTRALADFRVPGAGVGVVHRGEVIYAEGFGYRDVTNRLPVTPQTLFAIGSSTKAFTTFALGQLADEGRFDWDKPVREYLPGLQLWDATATAQLTARDMVTHRSGLPRHDLTWYNNLTLTPDQLFQRLRHLEPNRQLRERWQYNNIMYVMAGHLLGRLTDGTWDAAVRRQIFEPLGMTASNFSVIDTQHAPDHALPYREQGDTLVRIAFRNIDNVGPAGSINSNIEDMLKWAAVHVSQGKIGERAIIQSATLRDMHTPHMVIAGIPNEAELSPSSYGLGWIINTYRGKYRVQHGGNIDGFSALVTLYPREELAVVVLTNKNATGLPGLLTDHVADRVLDLPHRDWLGEAHARLVASRASGVAATQRLEEERVTGTRPAFPLAAYAAEYTHPGYGPLRIELRGQRLFARFNEIETPLEHWHYEVFSGAENPDDPAFHRAKIQFHADLHGRISAATIAMDPMVPPIRFERGADAQLRDPAFLARLAGRYSMQAGGTIVISVVGDRVVMEVPGQPPYRLEPDRDHEFRLPSLSGFRVRFVMAQDGTVRELRLIQPNGIFVATPAAPGS
jgi:CubicO group peptidase (beta-lactamase class C family)